MPIREKVTEEFSDAQTTLTMVAFICKDDNTVFLKIVGIIFVTVFSVSFQGYVRVQLLS